MTQLIQLLLKLTPFIPGLEDHLKTIIEPFEFKKNEIILKAGEVSKLIAYIESGIVLSYYTNKKGRNISNWFMGKGDLFISVLSFHRGIPSPDSHIALTPCKCWGTTVDKLEDTYTKFVGFERTGRILTADYYCRSEERHMMLRRQTPLEKVSALMEQFPDLLQHATNQQIATFLDMSESNYTIAKNKYYGRG